MENMVIEYVYTFKLDHREFLQIFANTCPQGGYHYQAGRLTIERGLQRIVIHLSPTALHHLNQTEISITEIKFEFFYMDAETAQQWMQKILSVLESNLLSSPCL